MEHETPGGPRTCMSCGSTYFLDAGELVFFDQKHIPLPKRCVNCRELRKSNHEGGDRRRNTLRRARR